MTGLPLPRTDLVPNHAIKSLIGEWLAAALIRATIAAAAFPAANDGAEAADGEAANASGENDALFNVQVQTPGFAPKLSLQVRPSTPLHMLRRLVASATAAADDRAVLYPAVIINRGRSLPQQGTVGSCRIVDGDTILVYGSGGAGQAGSFTASISKRVSWENAPPAHFIVSTSETVASLQLRLWALDAREVAGRDRGLVSREDDLLYRYKPSRVTLWHGLKVVGDGISEGRIVSATFSGHVKNSFLELASTCANRSSEGGSEPAAALVLEARPAQAKPKSPARQSRQLSRLQAVQQLFFSLVNRTEAYDHPHRIGLVLFGSEVELTCPFTPRFEAFRAAVDAAKARGDTRLFDAVRVFSQVCSGLMGALKLLPPF
jgi:hypothetical protein